jgi:hypothetical protein
LTKFTTADAQVGQVGHLMLQLVTLTKSITPTTIKAMSVTDTQVGQV